MWGWILMGLGAVLALTDTKKGGKNVENGDHSGDGDNHREQRDPVDKSRRDRRVKKGDDDGKHNDKRESAAAADGTGDNRGGKSGADD